jgi:hypothetical protein
MAQDLMTFAVARGMEGMNRLAIFLNASPLRGAWHFASGTRFDQTAVNIDFDDPADLAPTLRRYRETRPASSA